MLSLGLIFLAVRKGSAMEKIITYIGSTNSSTTIDCIKESIPTLNFIDSLINVDKIIVRSFDFNSTSDNVYALDEQSLYVVELLLNSESSQYINNVIENLSLNKNTTYEIQWINEFSIKLTLSFYSQNSILRSVIKEIIQALTENFRIYEAYVYINNSDSNITITNHLHTFLSESKGKRMNYILDGSDFNNTHIIQIIPLISLNLSNQLNIEFYVIKDTLAWVFEFDKQCEKTLNTELIDYKPLFKKYELTGD